MLDKLFGYYRSPDQVSLYFIAPLVLQCREMRFGLNPFRNDGQPECMPHCDDCRGNGRIIRLEGNLPHERAIDLEGVEREVLEIAERGIAGPEIVHRKMKPHGPKSMER